jgi:UDP:flavonoid glycosyltransferase YjiC (YdhE family)
MRVLLSSTFFSGHLLPMMSYARALKHRGHDILMSAPASVRATLDQAGFAHVAVDSAPPEEMAAIWAKLDAANAEEALIIGIRDGFLGLFAKYAIPKLQATISEWQPDVVLRDSFEFAAAHAAERAAIPHARVAVHSNQHEASLFRFVLETIDDFRRAAGLPPDGGVTLRVEPIFSAFPALIDGSGESVGWPTPFRVRP